MCEVAELAESPKIHLHKRKPSEQKEEIRSLVRFSKDRKDSSKAIEARRKNTHMLRAKKPGMPGEKVSTDVQDDYERINRQRNR